LRGEGEITFPQGRRRRNFTLDLPNLPLPFWLAARPTSSSSSSFLRARLNASQCATSTPGREGEQAWLEGACLHSKKLKKGGGGEKKKDLPNEKSDRGEQPSLHGSCMSHGSEGEEASS